MGNLLSACRKIRDDFNNAGKPQIRITLIPVDHADHSDYEHPHPQFEEHRPLPSMPLLPPLPPVYSTNSPPPYMHPPRYSEVDRSRTRARRVRAMELREREREREREVRRANGEPGGGTRTTRPWVRHSMWQDLRAMAM